MARVRVVRRNPWWGILIIGGMLFFAGRGAAAEHKVRMSGWLFIPAELTIKAGDSVTWVNEDDTTHKVAFVDPASGGPAEESPARIRIGETFTHTFDKKGAFDYYCQPHRSQDMKGRLIVE